MALPKLVVPKYKLKLPSDGRTVNYRPFLVKEEKLLLLATETGEQAELITAINIEKAYKSIGFNESFFFFKKQKPCPIIEHAGHAGRV